MGSATTASTATTATNFSGSIAGDVSGTQGATSVDKIKGVGLDFSVAPTNGQVLKFNGTNWAPAADGNAGGTVTSVTAAGTAGNPLAVSGTATAPTVDIAKATSTANGYLASTDWTTFNNKQNASLADGKIWVGQTGIPMESTPTGDVSMSNAGAFTVTGIRGKSVSATAPSLSGQVLRYDGASTYIPAFLGLADIKSTITPYGGAFANAGCTVSQTLFWQSSTDTFECQNVTINDSQLSYTTSRTANTFLAAPNGSAGAAAFRTIASTDLPAGTLSGAGTAGYLPYYNAANTLANSPIFTSGGNVGIGTTTPDGSKLQVVYSNAVTSLSTTIPGLLLTNNNATAGAINSMLFANSGGFGSAAIFTTQTNSTNLGDNLILETKSGTSTAWNANQLVLSNNGNVGIGTTTPGASLEIVGTGIVYSKISSSTNTGAAAFQAVNDVGNTIEFGGYGSTRADSGAVSTGDAYIYGSAGGFAIVADGASGVIKFGTGTFGGPERMRIDSTGKVGIGTNAPISTLEVANAGGTAISVKDNNNVNIDDAYNSYIQGVDSANNTNWWVGDGSSGKQIGLMASQPNYSLFLGTNGIERLNIDANGNVGIGTGVPSYTLHVNGTAAGTSWTNLSDKRFKKNIVGLDESLQKILLLQGVRYDWRQDEFPERKFSEGKQIGFIAQEVEKVFPEAVTSDKDGYKGVQYANLVAPVVEAIKEIYQKLIGQSETIEKQNREIASLKEENEAIKQALCDLGKHHFCKTQSGTK